MYIFNATDQVGGTVPRFWTTPVEQAYASLQASLAAKYDSAPEIQDVSITGCMTIYAEPLIRETSSAQTIRNLLAAGYTSVADEQCQQQEITAHAVWTHTHSSLAFNPYQVINANGTAGVNEAFTQSLMGYCRQVLGDRCTLGNDFDPYPEQPRAQLRADVRGDTCGRSDELLSNCHRGEGRQPSTHRPLGDQPGRE